MFLYSGFIMVCLFMSLDAMSSRTQHTSAHKDRKIVIHKKKSPKGSRKTQSDISLQKSGGESSISKAQSTEKLPRAVTVLLAALVLTKSAEAYRQEDTAQLVTMYDAVIRSNAEYSELLGAYDAAFRMRFSTMSDQEKEEALKEYDMVEQRCGDMPYDIRDFDHLMISARARNMAFECKLKARAFGNFHFLPNRPLATTEYFVSALGLFASNLNAEQKEEIQKKYTDVVAECGVPHVKRSQIQALNSIGCQNERYEKLATQAMHEANKHAARSRQKNSSTKLKKSPHGRRKQLSR